MARLTLVLALVTVRRGAVDAGAAPEGRSEARGPGDALRGLEAPKQIGQSRST